jgi:hypothetical protein
MHCAPTFTQTGETPVLRGLGKVASPLFCFNGVSPSLPSFQRVLSALQRIAGNEDSLMPHKNII